MTTDKQPQSVEEAIERALSAQKSKHEEEVKHLRHQAGGLKRLVVVLSLALAGAVAYGVHGWMNPDVGPPVDAVEAARLAVFDAIERVDAFAEANGRLPADLVEVGYPDFVAPAYGYRTDGSGGYALEVDAGGTMVSYRSGDDLTPFYEAAGLTLIPIAPPQDSITP